jgi:hypothetical protein
MLIEYSTSIIYFIYQWYNDRMMLTVTNQIICNVDKNKW